MTKFSHVSQMLAQGQPPAAKRARRSSRLKPADSRMSGDAARPDDRRSEREGDRHARIPRPRHRADRRYACTGASYLNFTAEGLTVRAAYGEPKYRRPVALKDRYDPATFVAAESEHRAGP